MPTPEQLADDLKARDMPFGDREGADTYAQGVLEDRGVKRGSQENYRYMERFRKRLGR